MKIIKQLSEMMSEEIADADRYAECALRHKGENNQLADLFYRLSNEEMQHMALLHDQASRLILEYRTQHGDPPEAMMAVYNYLHEKQIDEAAKVKAKQSMYKS
jgi:ferritin